MGNFDLGNVLFQKQGVSHTLDGQYLALQINIAGANIIHQIS